MITDADRRGRRHRAVPRVRAELVDADRAAVVRKRQVGVDVAQVLAEHPRRRGPRVDREIHGRPVPVADTHVHRTADAAELEPAPERRVGERAETSPEAR